MKGWNWGLKDILTFEINIFPKTIISLTSGDYKHVKYSQNWSRKIYKVSKENCDLFETAPFHDEHYSDYEDSKPNTQLSTYFFSRYPPTNYGSNVTT